MTKEIITIQNVHAYIDEQGTAWLNAEDVARGLGFTQTAASGNEVVRWERINKYLNEFGFIPTSGDDVKAGDFIPENMFYRLAMKAKNEAAEKFQAIVADEILPTLRKTGTYSVRPKATTPVAELVADVGNVAENIQSLFVGVKRGIALSQAIDLVGTYNNFSLESLKQLLPPAKHNIGRLNATQIGERLGLGTGKKAGHRANGLLEVLSYQVKCGNNWRLTDTGAAYGEELPYTRNGHSGYQILWSEDVLDVLGNCL